MKEEEILNILKSSYNIDFKCIEKIKGSYKACDSSNQCYCVKTVKYKFSHFKFILSAILHLKNRKFDAVLDIIKTKDDQYFIKFLGKYAFLTKWIAARECNYQNTIELEKACIKLSELHRCSENFLIDYSMTPRIGWFSWINTFETRKNEILDFQNRINQKAYKSEFDNLFLSCVDEEVERAKRSIVGLKNSEYIDIMKNEVTKRGFCHHDYANHNVLIDSNNNINIIDFDYCILDTRLHDLASLMIRTMKNGEWGVDKGRKIIEVYSREYPVREEEIDVIKEFIRFPQSFWQIGLQKYWEQQSWKEEFFLKKLSKYVEDRKDREDFINKIF